MELDRHTATETDEEEVAEKKQEDGPHGAERISRAELRQRAAASARRRIPQGPSRGSRVVTIVTPRSPVDKGTTPAIWPPRMTTASPRPLTATTREFSTKTR